MAAAYTSDARDAAFMRRALELAARGSWPDPNPRVGCVVVDASGELVGEGWHRGAGTPHGEAAALGVPTVAYDVAGLRDSVRDGVTGWLVGDGERLADVVDRALKELADPVRRAWIQRECRAWASRFTWRSTGVTMTALITAELEKSGYIHKSRLRTGDTDVP